MEGAARSESPGTSPGALADTSSASFHEASVPIDLGQLAMASQPPRGQSTTSKYATPSSDGRHTTTNDMNSVRPGSSVAATASRPSGDTASATSARKRLLRPRISIVIGAVCAMIVLVVAASTLAITISVSSGALTENGERFARALATNARHSIEAYLDQPTRQLDALGALFRQKDGRLPSDEPDQHDDELHQRMWQGLYQPMAEFNFGYNVIGYLFDDASSVAGYYDPALQMYYSAHRFRGEWPQGDMVFRLRGVNTTTGREIQDVESLLPPFERNQDNRFLTYRVAVSLVAGSPVGLTYPTQVLVRPFVTVFAMPFAKPLFNASNYLLGFATFALSITEIGNFLRSIEGTPNTFVFAVEAGGTLLGSSHPAPFSSFTRDPLNGTGVVGRGCASSGSTSTDSTQAVFIGCRLSAREFSAYPPLQAAAAMDGLLDSTSTELRTVESDGEQYIAVSTPIVNSYRFWKANVILMMPKDDILGDLERGRNLAIGVTAAVFCVAVCCSFILVHALLRPLTHVSERMRDTAQLRVVADDLGASAGELSFMAEVQDLQKAYGSMSRSIRSFTRYLPCETIRELMAVGQLNSSRIAKRTCTVLFADIAGFSTMCERVPVDGLSALLRFYFDRASHIIALCDGVIDQFIGDSMMTVWGVPYAVSNPCAKAALCGVLLNRETRVDPLCGAWDEVGEVLRVNVGIATGEVLAGNMGSAERVHYTVVGDAVKLASRLETVGRQTSASVVVCERTFAALNGSFVARLLPTPHPDDEQQYQQMYHAPPGARATLNMYDVLGMRAKLPPAATAAFDSEDDACEDSSDDAYFDHVVDAAVGSPQQPSPRDRGRGRRRRGRRGSSVSSVSSVASAVPAWEVQHPDAVPPPRRRRGNMATVRILREAASEASKSIAPTVCHNSDENFARLFTQAVTLYARHDYAGAIDAAQNALDAAGASIGDIRLAMTAKARTYHREVLDDREASVNHFVAMCETRIMHEHQHQRQQQQHR